MQQDATAAGYKYHGRKVPKDNNLPGLVYIPPRLQLPKSLTEDNGGPLVVSLARGHVTASTRTRKHRNS